MHSNQLCILLSNGRHDVEVTARRHLLTLNCTLPALRQTSLYQFSDRVFFRPLSPDYKHQHDCLNTFLEQFDITDQVMAGYS
jgi:hypothetical protein